MPAQPLDTLPSQSNVFIDSNVFIYGLSGGSRQCFELLLRVSDEEIAGFTSYDTVSDVTHRLMVGEAAERGYIARPSAYSLQKKPDVIPKLKDYWERTQRILNLNLVILETDAEILRQAQQERMASALLTDDSIIIAFMRLYGIPYLASLDTDFERVSGIVVFQPTDVSQP